MKLLHAIYSSPVQLLKKAEEDGSALVSAVGRQDKVAARAALFNFVVTAYHVWEWVKAQRPDLAAAATNPLTLYESIAACRDLANASKHAILDVTRGSYQKHPPLVQDVAVSAMGLTAIGGRATLDTVVVPASQDKHAAPWRLKVQLTSGRRLPVEHLVAEAIGAWKGYFARPRSTDGVPVQPERDAGGSAVIATCILALLLALGSPAWAASRCTTYEEKTLGRLHTLCDDGTRGISTYNKTLGRWETTITPPPSYLKDKRPPQPKARRP